MDEICDYQYCSGCGACSGICPKNCITLTPDKKKCGHIYPIIDNNVCIDCKLCEKTCPVNHPATFSLPYKTFAAYALDDEICDSSSSGGLAFTIAANIINGGGVVYGSVIEYGEKFEIHHSRCSTIDELKRTRGSKYVHSHMPRQTYLQIKNELDRGSTVLFVGTGCEVAGVKNFLKKDYPNFYSIDIICHGVPPQQLLIDYLSKNFDISEIKQLSFRDKKGFDLYGVYGVYGTPIYKPLRNNLYMMGFMKGLYYREACYTCSFAHKERVGDITLGDFWGLKKTISPTDRKSSGTSVVLVNTKRGEVLLNRINSALKIEERPLDEAVAGNGQLRHPSKKHSAANIFKRLYPILGFRPAARLALMREKIFYAYFLPFYQRIQR